MLSISNKDLISTVNFLGNSMQGYIFAKIKLNKFQPMPNMDISIKLVEGARMVYFTPVVIH